MTRIELEKAVVAKLPAIDGLRWNLAILGHKRQRVLDVVVSTLAENERLKSENDRLRSLCEQRQTDIRRLQTIQESADERLTEMAKQIEESDLMIAGLNAKCRILKDTLEDISVG